MLLTLAEIGNTYIIKKINGTSDIRQHLESLGFVVGASISIINSSEGDLVVNIKESRIAINREMAANILL